MVVDRLEVHLAGQHEVVVLELGLDPEELCERDAHGVLDETRAEMSVLHDEELVRPLEELEHGRAHRALDDAHQILCVELALRADEQGAPAPLVVRRERDELEDAVDVVPEARLDEPLRGVVADEALRARAGVDPGRLDPDDAARAARGRRGDPDQRDDLLGREARDRSRAA